jgi:hypothetical protein
MADDANVTYQQSSAILRQELQKGYQQIEQ